MRNFLMNTGSRITFAADGRQSGPGWQPLTPGGTFNGIRPTSVDDDNAEPLVEEPTEEELAEDPTLATDGENFFEAVTELWDDPKPEGTQPAPPTPEQIEANNTASQTRLNNYVKGLNLSVQIDPDKFKEAAEANDPKILNDAIAASQQLAYSQMLKDVTKMISEMRTDLRQEMDGAAQRRLQVSASEQSLLDTLPFLKQKTAVAVRPIAIAVKARFLKRGFDDDKANQLTKRFFKETQQMTAESLADDDITNPPGTRTGDRGYNQAPPQRGRKSSDTTDWIEVLTGRKSK